MSAPLLLAFLRSAEGRSARSARSARRLAIDYIGACNAAERIEPAMSRALAASRGLRATRASAIAEAMLKMAEAIAALEESGTDGAIEPEMRDVIAELRGVVVQIGRTLDRGGRL